MRGPKGPEWFGASLTMEDQMKLVTRFEAASLSTEQLHGLFEKLLALFLLRRVVRRSAKMLWLPLKTSS